MATPSTSVNDMTSAKDEERLRARARQWFAEARTESARGQAEIDTWASARRRSAGESGDGGWEVGDGSDGGDGGGD